MCQPLPRLKKKKKYIGKTSRDLKKKPQTKPKGFENGQDT